MDIRGWLVERRELRLARWGVVIAATLCAACMLAFGALQYAMPPTFSSPLGLNLPSVSHYQHTLLGGVDPAVSEQTFVNAFHILLGSAWVCYAIALGLGLTVGAPPFRYTLALVGATAFLLAVWCPPSLSTDVYAYNAHARVKVNYDKNPYVTTPYELNEKGDPTTRFVGYLQIPCVYGPIWLLLSMAGTAATRHTSLWWQITLLKLLEAAALMAAAIAGRELGERFRPGRGRLSAMAIGLNPLLLLEGPCNGHNDLLMMALMLWAAVLYGRGLRRVGDLLLGLAIGIKFVPVVVLPWLALERGRGLSLVGRLRETMLIGVLTLTPVVLAYIPFWQGSATFTAQSQRASWGTIDPSYDQVQHWLINRGFDEARTARFVRLIVQWPVILAYAGLAYMVARGKSTGLWLDAWALFSLALIARSVGVRFPWYLAWPICTVLTRWDPPPRLVLAALCLGYAAITTLFDYSG
jgi:hypothetical protein